MTTKPLSGSRALTLPPVQTTKPFLGNSRCSFQTCSFSWSSMLYLLSVDPPGSLLTVGIVGDVVYHVTYGCRFPHSEMVHLFPDDSDGHPLGSLPSGA